MKTTLLGFLAAGVVAVSVYQFIVATARVSQPAAPAERIARGSYLVNQLGLCIDCHSPRNEKGEHLPGQHLTGAPIGFQPLVPMPWASAAPRLAGLPAGFTAEQMVAFLMTGKRPGDRPAVLPPMPPYRMNREDAEATVAYLQSLPVPAAP
jgi:mono/diheme cytochrome c family protein